MYTYIYIYVLVTDGLGAADLSILFVVIFTTAYPGYRGNLVMWWASLDSSASWLNNTQQQESEQKPTGGGRIRVN